MLEDTDGYMYRYYKSCDTQEKEIISTWTQHVKAVLTDTIGQSEADYAADYQLCTGTVMSVITTCSVKKHKNMKNDSGEYL